VRSRRARTNRDGRYLSIAMIHPMSNESFDTSSSRIATLRSSSFVRTSAVVLHYRRRPVAAASSFRIIHFREYLTSALRHHTRTIFMHRVPNA